MTRIMTDGEVTHCLDLYPNRLPILELVATVRHERDRIEELMATLREARPCVYSNRKSIDEAKFAPIRKRIDAALGTIPQSPETRSCDGTDVK